MCTRCASAISPGARVCKECDAYTNPVRRFFSATESTVAWFTALFAVIAALFSGVAYFRDRESNTQFRVTGASSEVIHLRVWNTGNKPSVLHKCELTFAQTAGVRDRSLELVPQYGDAERQEAIIIVTNGPPEEISLSASAKLHTSCPPQDDPCVAAAEQALIRGHYKLLITVEESGHRWSLIAPKPYPHDVPDGFSGDLISEFLKGVCCVP